MLKIIVKNSENDAPVIDVFELPETKAFFNILEADIKMIEAFYQVKLADLWRQFYLLIGELLKWVSTLISNVEGHAPKIHPNAIVK
jgi:hypothetical protein